MSEQNYLGWKNRQTWNVALWINNDEQLYRMAVEFMKNYKGHKPYGSFVRYAGLENERTPDNISYSGTKLSHKELNAMMRELN